MSRETETAKASDRLRDAHQLLVNSRTEHRGLLLHALDDALDAYPLPSWLGSLEISNRKGGHGSSHSPTLFNYRWISTIFRNSNGLELGYTIALSQEDLDVKTGNIHVGFTLVQIIRNRFDVSDKRAGESGGHANPSPSGSFHLVYEGIENAPVGGYSLSYLSESCYPRAVRQVESSKEDKSRTINCDIKPWGKSLPDIVAILLDKNVYGKDQMRQLLETIGYRALRNLGFPEDDLIAAASLVNGSQAAPAFEKDELPPENLLDMTDRNYSPKRVAALFMLLAAADIAAIAAP